MTMQPSSSLSPENTIVVFDIHGVLFKRNYKKTMNLLWQNKKVVLLARYMLHPRFMYDLCTLMLKRAVPEECIMTLCQKYPGIATYKHLAINIANAQDPIQETLDIVSCLKKRGYVLHIFSNIGAVIFVHLAARHQAIFSNFDAVQVPNQENSYLAKNNPKAFAHYLATYNQHNKTILFIDDNRQNIRRATDAGMISIYFENPDQLRNKLTQFDLL
ncbi:MAG: hypothetical protein NTX86_03200 [Candidatus Dependentiae bacterium]|nr:hypothetical protein [Candidatus Dependentiae bacterium]